MHLSKLYFAAGGAVQIYLNKSRATVPGSAFIRPSLFFCLESWRSTTDDCQFFQAQNWRTVPRAELAVGLRFNFACSGGGGRWRGGLDKHKRIQNFHRRLFWSVRRRLHWESRRAKGRFASMFHSDYCLFPETVQLLRILGGGGRMGFGNVLACWNHGF